MEGARGGGTEGSAVGEELRARGEEEGSWSETEEGVERTSRGARVCRQS